MNEVKNLWRKGGIHKMVCLNIYPCLKERLDFSCALFGPDGGLVSNAPHIPVHLGAMQDTVRHQMKTLGDDLHRGDVILANHPKAGGSHLPDLTIITPVFYKVGTYLVYIAR